MAGLQRVSFLIVGAQKAGTSALVEYLREVPGLQLPAIKEAHFFDDDFLGQGERIDWSAPDYAAYHALFEEDGRLWGEATPIYIYWPSALERIQAYNPDCKLILILRDPVERAWSQWQMEYAKGKETESFAWCIREGRARMTGATPWPGVHRVQSYVERGFYGEQLAHLLQHFPRDQLLILESRQLADDPDAVIANVCTFLEVAPPAQALTPRRVREAPDIAYPSQLTTADIAYLQGLYSADLARLRILAQMPELLCQ